MRVPFGAADILLLAQELMVFVGMKYGFRISICTYLALYLCIYDDVKVT